MLRRGFSLLELTVLLTLVGILLAVGIPHLSLTRDRAAARAAMGDLAAAVSTARRSAILRRTLVAVVLDTGRAVVHVRAGGQILFDRDLRAAYGIALGSNRDSLVYDPRGLGYGLSNLTVTVRSGSIVDTLTMSRLGRVKW
jgi:Tfp pilus assembly protein FimT